MNNNLYKVEKDLRSIAKRYKLIKYSVGLAILFLMMGVGAFSEEIDNAQTASTIPTREEIATSRENLRNSVGSLQSKIDQAKAENEKNLAGLKLELVQLMEQGDQVVKSPWMSWQFGANYMYSKWNGTYKGRGDKAEKYPFEGVFARSTNSFERYVTTKSTNYGMLAKSSNLYSASTSSRNGLGGGYGIASTIPVPETPISLELNAGVRPKKVDKQPLNIQLDPVNAPAAPILNVSANTPVAVTPPTVTPPTVTLNLPTPNTKPFNDFSFHPNRYGDYDTGGSITAILDKKEDPKSVYTLGINPDRLNMDPDNLQSGDLDNKAYRIVNGTKTTAAPANGALVRPNTATAIWRINNKRGTLRNENNESKWESGMSEDVNNPEVKGFTYGGNSATDRVKFYVAGDINGSNKLGGSENRTGAVALHSVWNGRYHDIEGYLKGRATMFSIETWHSPKLVFKNIKVDIQGNENTLFYIYPTNYDGVVAKDGISINDYNSFAQRGAFIGEVNADIKSQKNAIYSIMGISGGLNITSTGVYRLEGSNNIVYSGLGYSPSFQNFIGNDAAHKYVSDRYKTGMTPVINLKTAPESYGDGNVIMYFSDLIPDNTTLYPKTSVYNTNDNQYRKWRKSKIGIYQGEIRASARIGEKLTIDSKTTQTTVGNKIQRPDGSLVDGNNKYVENNVGIFAQSGQRGAVGTRAITPTEDLGAIGYDYVNADKIHALYVNDIDITFGKYSKGGIMVASERGTQVDVAVTDVTNPHHTDIIKNGSGNAIAGLKDKATVPVRTVNILDYNKAHTTYTNDNKIVSSTVDSTNEAAVGTIIGYAKGIWGDSTNRMNNGSEGGISLGMSQATRDAFKNAKSEINFGVPVEMSAKYAEIGGKKFNPVAYVAEGGKITAKSTTAYGYGSVIAYAKNYTNNSVTSSGEIEINGNIEAIDKWAANDANTNKEKYKNLGAYADGQGTKIKVTGNAKINGLAAFADNKGIVSILGNSSVLNTGASASLAALNGGNVTFGGGTINVGNNAIANSTAFYADNKNNSKINFTGTTKITMSKGTFLVGLASDYTKASATTGTNGEITGGSKYNGMEKVELTVTGDAKIVKNTEGGTTTWTGPGSLASDVKTTTKINKITAPAANYLAYYSNGNYIVNANAQLGKPTAADSFDTIKMTREKVTINSGKKVYSTTGTGLAMASSKGATSNAVSGYENKGIVDISGGGTTKAGINVSYGTITNSGTVKVDNGVGLYGTNGSKIENKNNGIINITKSGYGIVGMATGKTAQDYGRDTTAGSAVEIINNGQINVAGNNAIAIYADDNKGVGLNEITVTNTHKLVVNGNKGVGIVLRDSKNSGSGGIINVTGTGSSDIVTGINGVGIYAENSEIKLNSNYGIETKEGGVGIYASKSSIPTSSTLEYKYSGSKSGRGMAIVYTKANTTNNTNIKLVNNTKTIGGLIGIFANGGGTFTNNGTISGSSTAKEFAIIAENTNINNSAAITLGNASSISTPNIALYSKTNNAITNSSTIKVGDNSIGLYGYAVTNSGDLSVGSKGSAIYSQGGTVNITSGTINIGKNEAVGVYTAGNSQTITSKATAMNIEDGSFGFANVGVGNKLTTQTPNVTLKNNSMYIYSKNTATIKNETNLKSVGTTGSNYGIYASGTVTNLGVIDFKTGIGNVGIYSTYGGTATNNSIISVGASDVPNSLYSIGMAAGFIGDKTTAAYTGNIVNNGIINVTGKDSIGMYGVGSGTTVYNGTSVGSTATINLSADGAMGIYLDEGAKGFNYGTITTVGSPKKAVGVVIRKGAEFTNEGTITINSAGGYAFFKANGGEIKNYGNINITGGADKLYTPGNKPTTKKVGGVEIRAKAGDQEAKVYDPSGNIVNPTLVPILPQKNDASISSIGMYIDTLRGTNPINGLNAIKVTKADLIIGNEAAQKTTSKYIKVSKEILSPYNKAIANNPQITDWNIYSGAATWIATGTVNKDTGLINNIYMAKIPYTSFSGKMSTPVDSKDTYNFTNGLEQRYGIDGIGSRENQLFQKLNKIGNNEEILLFQAFDEMMGHQYANVQQRVQATGVILDKEFNYLKDEWRTASKDSNKIKTFGTSGEYKTNTAGVIDHKYNAYGVAYVHENEDIKLGRGIGWYTGIVHNTFKFKDIGNSKEQMLQGKVGMFKSVPFDDNNSLNWTISGELSVGYNKMHRKFLVVDEVFNAKSKYYTYGIGIRNEIGKEFRLSEDFTLRPYGTLKLEYGRVSKIREKSGEIKLEVKHNDYISIRPEIGAELGFKHYFGMKALRTTLGIAYENELGRVANGKNKARVVDTTADWFNIRGEKEDRKGNVKFDLNVGVDNTRYGVTANIGYDTKGENLRGGLGLRVIF